MALPSLTCKYYRSANHPIYLSSPDRPPWIVGSYIQQLTHHLHWVSIRHLPKAATLKTPSDPQVFSDSVTKSKSLEAVFTLSLSLFLSPPPPALSYNKSISKSCHLYISKHFLNLVLFTASPPLSLYVIINSYLHQYTSLPTSQHTCILVLSILYEHPDRAFKN